MDSQAHPTVSVIVPVLGHDDVLSQCLEAIRQQTYPSDLVETIVVENAAPVLEQRLHGRFPRVQWLVEKQPGSYAARNRGLRHTHAEVVAFTDADCCPTPDWLGSAVAELMSLRSPAMVAGRIRVGFRHGERPNIFETYDSVTSFNQRWYIEGPGFAATANLVAHKLAFDRVGPFDGGMLSGGDREWGQRARTAGVVQRYVPEAVVDHPARRTFAEVYGKATRIAGSQQQALMARGRALAFLKEIPGAVVPWRTYLWYRDRPELGSIRKKTVFFFLLGVFGVARILEKIRVTFGKRPRQR